MTVASFTATHVDMAEMMRLRNVDEAAFRKRTRAQHAAYLKQTVEAAGTGAQIVLWPELAGLGMTDDVEQLIAGGQVLANEHDIYLAMPLFVVDPAGAALPVNKIVVADPEGAIVLEHVKYGGDMLRYAARQPRAANGADALRHALSGHLLGHRLPRSHPAGRRAERGHPALARRMCGRRWQLSMPRWRPSARSRTD